MISIDIYIYILYDYIINREIRNFGYLWLSLSRSCALVDVLAGCIATHEGNGFHMFLGIFTKSCLTGSPQPKKCARLNCFICRS